MESMDAGMEGSGVFILFRRNNVVHLKRGVRKANVSIMFSKICEYPLPTMGHGLCPSIHVSWCVRGPCRKKKVSSPV